MLGDAREAEGVPAQRAEGVREDVAAYGHAWLSSRDASAASIDIIAVAAMASPAASLLAPNGDDVATSFRAFAFSFVDVASVGAT